MKLIWNKRFSVKKAVAFRKMQKSVDTECLERMTEFVPVAKPTFHNAGKLRDSGKIAESGLIVYTAPHARHDYYADVNHQRSGNPKGQRVWFEYTKLKYKNQIFQKVRDISKENFR